MSLRVIIPILFIAVSSAADPKQKPEEATKPKVPDDVVSPWDFDIQKVHPQSKEECEHCRNATTSSNSTKNATMLEELVDDNLESGGGLEDVGISVMVLAGLAFGGWQGFKWLTAPKKTPAPLLADTELGEGDPVNPSDGSSLWMGGTGPARELQMSSTAGFTQF
eukprot:TRINITY_DN41834_c0_g1_i1.p1 TRINITY_DN41834_c0_g1~~TRINITY_DN41834_c0_g1_i1.p1  ORF type:complete len:165 (+),score=49.40 TRINITY_DN41834_c0_g1_i1:46-540(+)